MGSLVPFPPAVEDYFEARAQFRGLVEQLGWKRDSLPISAVGPAGEELTMDVAWSNDQSDLPTFVLSIGLHGVEGFFGSDLQAALLSQLSVNQGIDTRGVRLVLIHALNPFGFAHLRRMDAENIDPNRNFLLPGQSFTGSPPGYSDLDPLLNPRTANVGWDWFYPRAAVAVMRRGTPTLKQAIATGQYNFPKGLFYGGCGPCETQRILARHLPQWVAGASRVVHFDVHTGLGRRGTAKLLIDSPLTVPQQSWLDEHLRRDSYEMCHSQGVAYEARGGLGPWIVATAGVPDYLFACAEFGTYAPLKVLAGLRAENREHHWGTPGSSSFMRAKERLRVLFYPAESALALGLDWIDGAIAGLRSRVIT